MKTNYLNFLRSLLPRNDPGGRRKLAGGEAQREPPETEYENAFAPAGATERTPLVFLRPCRGAFVFREKSGGYASLHHRLISISPPGCVSARESQSVHGSQALCKTLLRKSSKQLAMFREDLVHRSRKIWIRRFGFANAVFLAREASQKFAVVIKHVCLRLGEIRGAVRRAFLFVVQLQQHTRNFFPLIDRHASEFFCDLIERHATNLSHALTHSNPHFSP